MRFSGVRQALATIPGLAAFFAVLMLALMLASTEARAAKYAAIVVDVDSGEVLHESSADARRYPASLTKMMTLYLVFDALDSGELRMDQKITASRRASRQPPSRLGLRRGDKITVEQAILALVTKSANDVATVVAEALGGTEAAFARQMTLKARELGMRRTTFRNASGLYNRGQYSTARDLAKLSIALLRDHKKYYHYFSTKSFTFRGATHRNHNKLLRKFDGTDGIKTGYIRASGFNLAASAVRGGRRIVTIVMGGRTGWRRDREVVRLMGRAFAGKFDGTGEILVARAQPRTSLKPEPRPGSGAAPEPALAAFAEPEPRPAAPEPEVAAPVEPEPRPASPETELAGLNGPELRPTARPAPEPELPGLGMPELRPVATPASEAVIAGTGAPTLRPVTASAPEPIFAAGRNGAEIRTVRRSSGSTVIEANLPPPTLEAGDTGTPPTFHEEMRAGLQADEPWDIQVGAFRREQEALSAVNSAMKIVPKLVRGAEIAIEPVDSDIGSVYRARLRGMSSDYAVRACRILKERQMPCFAMRSPEPECETGEGDSSPGAC